MTDQFKDHFSGHSDAYAAYRPSYPAALGEYLAACGSGTGLALECGCGSAVTEGSVEAALAEGHCFEEVRRSRRVVALGPKHSHRLIEGLRLVEFSGPRHGL